jgi:putative transposase
MWYNKVCRFFRHKQGEEWAVTLVAFKQRLYPTHEQAQILSRTFGATRFVWNKSLAIKIAAYKKDKTRISSFDLIKMLPVWKAEVETQWLGEVSAVVLQQVLRDQDKAFNNFFNSISGKRKGPIMRYPKFKTRNSRKTLRYTSQVFNVTEEGLRLSKVPDRIKMVQTRDMPQNFLSATVSLDASGRWHVSLLAEVTVEPKPKTGAIVGIDLGLKTFAVLSDGNEIAHPKLLAKKAARLARYQRIASRRAPKPGQESSRNYVKAKTRVAKQHAKVADARRDFLQKLTTELVNDYDILAVEGLAVANLGKNHKLAKSIYDSGWGGFRTMLEYKAKWYGKQVVVIDRWFPSSKLCNNCGWKNNKLELSQRTWLCLGCGTLLDRDLNAAKNIIDAGLALLDRKVEEACGEGVSPKKSLRVTARKGRQPSVKQEFVPKNCAHAQFVAA